MWLVYVIAHALFMPTMCEISHTLSRIIARNVLRNRIWLFSVTSMGVERRFLLGIVCDLLLDYIRFTFVNIHSVKRQ